MKTQITLIFLFLIHFSSLSQTSDAFPPEVKLCDEFTEYVNSKQYIFYSLHKQSENQKTNDAFTR